MQKIIEYVIKREIKHLHYFFNHVNILYATSYLTLFVLQIAVIGLHPASKLTELLTGILIIMGFFFHIFFMITSHQNRLSYHEELILSCIKYHNYQQVLYRKDSWLEGFFDIARTIFLLFSFIMVLITFIF